MQTASRNCLPCARLLFARIPVHNFCAALLLFSRLTLLENEKQPNYLGGDIKQVSEYIVEVCPAADFSGVFILESDPISFMLLSPHQRSVVVVVVVVTRLFTHRSC